MPPAYATATLAEQRDDTTFPVGASSTSSASSNDDACVAAYRAELKYIAGTFRRLGIHRDVIEDLCQDVFVILRRKWRCYDTSRAFKPYLFGIILRVACGYKRRHRTELSYAGIPLGGQPILSPDEEYETTETRALVLSALRSLPMPRRAVVVMHELDRIPMKEVAATLSVPLFTAYSRLRKGREELETAIRRVLVQG
jgi:RNA polymerase sigma-70 factor (ECF subfamily)